jgi:hypothetical protein
MFYTCAVIGLTHPGDARRCGLCEIVKPLDESHRRGVGHQRWCKSCRKAYDAAYHRGRRTLRMAPKRARIGKLVAWMREAKSQPCTDCGGRSHPAVMAFDHLPGSEKRLDVANLVRRGSIRLARIEVAKCEVVCANCHAYRTFLRRESGQSTRSVDIA